LTDLYLAFCLNLLLTENPESFYMTLPPAAFTPKTALYHDTLQSLYTKLSQTLPTIVDAWDFDDEELVSVLGKKSHGSEDDLYREMLRVVRANPLNRNPVAKGFMRHVQPIIMGKL
jgi:hypothetical protein